MHGINLCQMSLQGFSGLHHLILGESFLLTPRDAGHFQAIHQYTSHGNIARKDGHRDRAEDWLLLTRAISELILLALYSILQVLRFATSLLDARLHLVRGDFVRHRHVGGL
jgi:hypothetical protein